MLLDLWDAAFGSDHHLLSPCDRCLIARRSRGIGKTVDFNVCYTEVSAASDPFNGWTMETWLAWAEVFSVGLLLGIQLGDPMYYSG